MPLEASDIQAIATALQNFQPSQSPAQVNATAVKLPSFWQGNPEVWFRQVDTFPEVFSSVLKICLGPSEGIVKSD